VRRAVRVRRVRAGRGRRGRQVRPEGPAAHTPLRWDRDRGEFRIGPVTGRAEVVPAVREWTLTFLALRPAGVTVDGRTVDVTGGTGRWSVTVSASMGAETVVRVEAGPLRVGTAREDAVLELLEAAQIGNPEKLAAWEVVRGPRPVAERLAELAAVELPDAVRSAITELLGSVGAGEG
jgi:hypothetical protein